MSAFSQANNKCDGGIPFWSGYNRASPLALPAFLPQPALSDPAICRYLTHMVSNMQKEVYTQEKQAKEQYLCFSLFLCLSFCSLQQHTQGIEESCIRQPPYRTEGGLHSQRYKSQHVSAGLWVTSSARCTTKDNYP